MKIYKKSINSFKIIIMCIFFVISVSILSFGQVYANTDIQKMIKKVEYSEDYKEWLKLDNEEKENILQPKMFNIENQESNENYLKNINNVLKISQLLRATLSNKYSLQTVIKDNVKIRNQMTTGACWAFATIGALETNLALRDKLDSKPITIYDYSEKHMNYGTTRNNFLNNKINEKGFSRQMDKGGVFEFARTYLTNGTGAVKEEKLPFDDSEDKIDISEIQNTTEETTLYDIVEFEVPTNSTKQDVITKMKEHISNYGGIYAGIYGADLISDNYNNETGAIYCSDSKKTPQNHAVTIIGWDDDYNKNNFNEKNRPNENGAWIIKNSWGESISQNLNELKESIYNAQREDCNSQGWNSAEQIPDQVIVELLEEAGYSKGKVKIEGDNIIIEIGDKGYMYISYEDDNVYKTLYGIEKAKAKKDYYNLYQNDVLGPSSAIQFDTNANVFIANVFKRDSSKKEVIDRVSLYTIQDYTCKVYVNPNGSDKSLSNLQQVKLASGETESFKAGYHTIEFAEPVELNSDTFTVVVEIIKNSSKIIPIEQIDNNYWKDAKVNKGESFITDAESIKTGEWEDLATIANKEIQGNVTIKAFTQKKETTQTINPTSSNFDKSVAELTNSEHYFYTKNPDDVYSKLKIKVSNIKLGNEKNKYTYYYYLSGTQGDKNIPAENWKKVTATKQSDGTYTILVDTDSKDIPNYNDIAQSNNLYIYIKEVAEIENKKVEAIKSLKVENKSTSIFYLDGEKVGSLDEVLNKINSKKGDTSKQQEIKNKSEDNTKAKLPLPQTGTISIIIAIFAILTIGGYSYYRYKNIDR